MYVNRSNTEFRAIPGRALLDAGVDVLVLRRPELVASFTATNIGDVHTQDFAAYPLPGRAFFATLTFRLDLSSPRSSAQPSRPEVSP